MLILIATLIPAAVLAVPLWRGAWRPTSAKALAFAACVPLAALIGILFNLAGTHSLTSFREVRSVKVAAVRYYERWNERVSCRHPIYETKHRTVTRTRTDSSGKKTTTTETETYREVVGHEHPYDVDDHPPHWAAFDEQSVEHPINQADFDRWQTLWANKTFVELHRNFHTIDGNLYESRWTGDFERIYPWSDIHRYENRVRATRSVFSAAPADDAARKAYPRPADRNDTSVLHGYGVPVSNDADWMFRRLNADLGPRYKVHNLVLLFDAATFGPAEVERVKAAWQGPNKNELVTCIGLTADNKIAWCDVFSWMDDTTIHSLIRQDVTALGTYDPNRLLDILKSRIPTHWHKKNFHDFDYLHIPVPAWAHVTAYLSAATLASLWAWFLHHKTRLAA